MDDKQFYKNIAKICEALLKTAKFNVLDIGLLNETMMELDERADKAGMKYKDLYPDSKR